MRWAVLLGLVAVVALMPIVSPVAAQTSPPVAILTPSGVPVAVVEGRPGGHLVTTPCGNEAFVAGGTPLHDITVVIDPGHGGPVDTGAVGANGLNEKDVNLDVARAAARFLKDNEISAVLTRTADYATPLRVRANLADVLDAEVLLSIHHNAPIQAPSPTPGVEIFHENGSEESRRLGGLIYEKTMSAFSGFAVDWVAPADAGVMAVLNTRGQDAYGMIRIPETTSVLIELGYLANPSEAAFFASPLYPRLAGRAVADGVLDYLHTGEAGSGYVEARIFNPQPGVGRSLCEEVRLGSAGAVGEPR